jgi:hypothetical protein
VALGQHSVPVVAEDELKLGELVEQPAPVAVEHLAVLVVLRPHRPRDRLGFLPQLVSIVRRPRHSGLVLVSGA